MKRILIITFLLLSINSFGQIIKYSVELSYNLPYIAEIESKVPIANYNTGFTSITTSSELKETYDSKSGGKIGTNLSFQLSNNLHIESGLILNLIRYKQSTIISNNDLDNITIGNINDEIGITGVTYEESFFRDSLGNLIIVGSEPISSITQQNNDLGKTSILYTEIPVKLAYSFFNNKLICKLGFSVSFLTYSQIYKYSSDYELHNLIIKDTTSDGLSNVIWNGNIEMEYIVYKNLGLNFSYNRSFNSVYDDNASIGKPKYNIFSLGVSYNFLK